MLVLLVITPFLQCRQKRSKLIYEAQEHKEDKTIYECKGNRSTCRDSKDKKGVSEQGKELMNVKYYTMNGCHH
jgi:hypothetical protein